ncbi:MAG: hypothetical protein CL674_10995 [Bdellovibrionaceae bacterium]|nr:hypothetical protein [Pseudobdellovibrionaceae bacterium]|tara:strand:+ start:1317 stop:2366 length:1050 start_codon:yes stop_codon:yes gene_type:complete
MWEFSMNLRRQILPLFVILTWSFHLTAAPVAPIVACTLSLQEAGEPHKDKITNQYALTMNSLESILWHRFKLPKAEPNIQAVDFDSTLDYKNRKKISTAASRIQGILKFQENSADTESGMRKQTKTFSIIGDTKINSFLERHLLKLNDLEIAKRRETFPQYLMNTFFLSFLVLDSLVFHEATNGLLSTVLVPMGLLVFHPLNTLLEILKWDWQYENRINKMKNFIKNADVGDINLLSRDFSITQGSLKKLQTYGSDTALEEIGKDLHNEELTHSPPLILRIIRAFEGKFKTEKLWVGLDLVLEKKEDGQSELHFVTRYSEKMPIFPKSIPEKKKETLQGLKPVYIPGER